MEICKIKFINIILIFLLIFAFIKKTNAEINFQTLENKKVSYLDFFLLKFENKLTKRVHILRRQALATRVQYSSIAIEVALNNNEEIFVKMYAIMDKKRYSKKNYKQKLSDCNQVRNLIFYSKHGYKFFTQKRDPSLSTGLMEDIFVDVFFNNIRFTKNEIKFLLDRMFVDITIFNPVKKIELRCSGKVNQYELN